MNAELSVRKTVLENGLIQPGDRVILGLSGGPDSLCLLHVLAKFQKSWGFALSALHVNHLMRGEAAKADVDWLYAHCKELGVPLSVAVCDVYQKAEEEGISVEEAGRKARHNALFRQKATLESPCSAEKGRVLIALAHNRDDQAETVLMRALRGTGIHGLAAMEYKREDGLIRPLLDTPRSEIEAYCTSLGLAPRWDSTNGDLSYTRNRLRLQLIPAIEADFNPNVKEGLARLAQSAREDDALLEEMAREECRAAAVAAGAAQFEGYGFASPGKFVSFPVKRLAQLPAPIAKRVIRLQFAQIGLTEDIASPHLESLLAAARGRKTGKCIEFPQGFAARVTHESVEFLRRG